ncbi:MAG TPA: ABC transporter substrate-binding protein [Albitalea sp.]|nr:ABC transporter substrate-binding protein [Albitalea sp.]
MNCTRRLAPFVLALFIGSPTTTAIAAASVQRVGVLALGSVNGNARDVAAISDRLGGLGHAVGRTLVIESRFADGRAERLPALAADLVRLNVDVIVTITTPAAQAAKAATSGIPIVMAGSANPVELGLVSSLARPGANVTGVTNSPGGTFTVKQLQLLKDAAPRISRVAVLMTSHPVETRGFAAMQAASEALGVTLIAFEVESPTGIDFDALRKLRADALYVFPNAINAGQAKAIVVFAAENRLPAIYGERVVVEAGGLMSYWTDWIGLRRHAAEYVDRILRGAKAGDLPVEDPTTFELVINLKTARALGLTIPQSLLLRADEVIE